MKFGKGSDGQRERDARRLLHVTVLRHGVERGAHELRVAVALILSDEVGADKRWQLCYRVSRRKNSRTRVPVIVDHLDLKSAVSRVETGNRLLDIPHSESCSDLG